MWYKESQSNISIPALYNPVRSTKYVIEYNLENRQGTSRKYYTIRVYDYEDGNYSVIAYRGRIGGSSPFTEPKGMYRSLSSALDVAQSLRRTKMNGGYRDRGDYRRANIPVGIYGEPRTHPRTVSPTSPSTPSQPTRPTDAIFNSTQATSTLTPPEQLEAALFNTNLHASHRSAVAENPSTPPEALFRFVTEHSDNPTPNDVVMFMRIAKNTSTPPLALDTLLRKFYLKDRIESEELFTLSAYVVNNDNTPSSALRWVVEQDILTNQEPSVIARLALESGKVPPSAEAKWRIKFREQYEGGNAKYIETMIALMGRSGVSEDPTVQQEIADTLLQADYMSLINAETVGQLIENFVDRLLSSDRFRNIILERFPKTFFDRVSMTPQNREVVGRHFGGTQEEDPDMSFMKNLFSKNRGYGHLINNNYVKELLITASNTFNLKQYSEKNKEDKIPLTTEERQEVKDRFGSDLECSFAKDKDGYYCYTHRARSDSYPTISKIPKSKVEFIGSTG